VSVGIVFVQGMQRHLGAASRGHVTPAGFPGVVHILSQQVASDNLERGSVSILSILMLA
jgi:hypothetical protein